ncbi:MAG: phosphonate ABC transporter, permease protein PhnE [Cyanobacteria bacterium P01_G01_bin.54]
MPHPTPTSSSPTVQALLAQEKPPITPGRVLGAIAAISILIYTSHQSDLSFGELFQDSGNMAREIRQYFPPDFTDWRSYLADLLETLSMAVWGTVLAAIVAIPLALLAAQNVAPAWISDLLHSGVRGWNHLSRVLGRWTPWVLPRLRSPAGLERWLSRLVIFTVRRALDAMRAINEMVFALIFLVAVGFGPFAGVLALFVHTAGTLGKLFSEAVEAIDPGPVEGIRATGASTLQEVVFGVLPQVMPLWTSFTLYRFEANVRSATVLGIVGAGGIGFSLFQSFRAYEYGKASAMLLIVISTVSLIDVGSSRIRQRLL